MFVLYHNFLYVLRDSMILQKNIDWLKNIAIRIHSCIWTILCLGPILSAQGCTVIELDLNVSIKRLE